MTPDPRWPSRDGVLDRLTDQDRRLDQLRTQLDDLLAIVTEIHADVAPLVVRGPPGRQPTPQR